MPEWLDRQDIDNGSWTIEAGLPIRGVPCTNISERRMIVPMGGAEAHRVIRAHELMHAKVSPVVLDLEMLADYYGPHIGPETWVAAEEMRVNVLVAHAGFNLDHLADGSEKTTGMRLAQMGLAGWDAMVVSLAGMYGSKAVNQFITGLRTVNPDMANAARAIVGELRKFDRKFRKSWGPSRWAKRAASTGPASLGGYGSSVEGFVRYTAPLAALLQSFMQTKVDGEKSKPVDRSESEKIEAMARKASGKPGWAEPILNTSVVLSKHIDGRIGRKRIASATGRTPRHLDRLLTDPERRVFDRRARGKGGVVLIDQSGSMHLSDADVMKMVEAAPGCVIIGYSHSSGDTRGLPNIWVIANRGKVAEDFPSGWGGNGVDGPALKFALSHRRTGEPFIWVCDGLVTDSNDDEQPELSEECAQLVIKHRIHMVDTAVGAIEALHRAATSPLQTTVLGPLRSTHAYRAQLGS